MTSMPRFLFATLAALTLVGCDLYFGDGRDSDDAAQADATVTAEPPHEMVPDECLGFDCAGTLDAGVDAPTDAELATHPPNPVPCLNTCVGASCALCIDASAP